MAVNDPTYGVPTPTGTLQGCAVFGWDGATWQPSGRASVGVGTPTGVLRGVAPFTWSGSAWTPAGGGPDVAATGGVLDGVAVYTWSGSAWVPAGGPDAATPTGVLQGVAAFNWDGTAWQPTGQAGPDVATPNGVLLGVAMFAASGSGSTATWLPAPTLDLNFLNTTALDPRVTFSRGSVATYFDAIGTMQTVTGNTPRFDYNPITHASLGLLIEESRTNSLLNSAALGTQSVTVTAQAYTLSFYGTGTITKSGTASGALVGTGAFPQRVSQTFTPTAGSLTLTVTGSVFNAQLEAGSFATSYIPTTAAAVTRSNDSAYVALAGAPWFSANAGTMAMDWDGLNSAATTHGLSSGAFGNSIYQTGNGVTALIGGTGQPALSAALPSYTGSVNRTAIAYGNSTLAVGINAVANSVAMAAGPYPWTTYMSLGGAPWALDGELDGHIRRVRYWPRLLSLTELQQVTT